MSDTTQTNGNTDLHAECKKWQARSAELLEERDRLALELLKATKERDLYLKTIGRLMSEAAAPLALSKEDMLACVGKEKPLDEFILELEREMGCKQ
jgi:hypothetical protein